MLDGPVPPLIVGAITVVLWAIARWRHASGQRALAFDVAVFAALLVSVISLELAMGRAPAYRHGPVRLWSGEINSDENSQQVFDAYTFTHVVHGAAFYAAARLLLGRERIILRAIAAMGLEASWEVYENTDQVINRYRAETIALGYYGDSVLNSVFDILACALGFVLAWKLPTRATVAWVAATEIILAVLIRDNLTLNILMLVHPLDAIRRWQLGG